MVGDLIAVMIETNQPLPPGIETVGRDRFGL
jgi:hypothetical protein